MDETVTQFARRWLELVNDTHNPEGFGDLYENAELFARELVEYQLTVTDRERASTSASKIEAYAIKQGLTLEQARVLGTFIEAAIVDCVLRRGT